MRASVDGERAGGGTEKEKVEATPSNRDVCEIQEPVARKKKNKTAAMPAARCIRY